MAKSHMHAPEPSEQAEPDGRAGHVRQALEGRSPSDLLTVGEAGRLLALSEALLRRRIKSGRLLHETGRRDGREVCLIRVVDLLGLFGPSRTDPFEAARRGPAVASELPAVEALSDVEVERDLLLERCEDLNDRLALLSLERQEIAPAAGPSRSQWLELESVVASRFVWWRRPSTFGWMASVAALFWLWNGADGARVLAQEQVADLVEEHRDVRGQFTNRLGEWRDQAIDTQEALAQERRAATRDRTLFDERLRDAHGQAESARAMVREDRLRFEGDRLRWSGLLEDTQETLGLKDAAWQASVAWNADQQAAFRLESAARDADLKAERQRSAEADLARRERQAQEQAKQVALIGALEGQVGAAQAQSSKFRGELERMGAMADKQEARIAAGLERMEQMQATQDARAQEEQARVMLSSQLGGFGDWLVLWAPRLHAGALVGARAPDSGGRTDDHEGPN